MARRRARPVLTPWARRRRMRMIDLPVREGEVLSVVVECVDHKRRGIVRISEYPILISNCDFDELGKSVTIKIEKVKPGFARASKVS